MNQSQSCFPLQYDKSDGTREDRLRLAQNHGGGIQSVILALHHKAGGRVGTVSAYCLWTLPTVFGEQILGRDFVATIGPGVISFVSKFRGRNISQNMPIHLYTPAETYLLRLSG